MATANGAVRNSFVSVSIRAFFENRFRREPQRGTSSRRASPASAEDQRFAIRPCPLAASSSAKVDLRRATPCRCLSSLATELIECERQWLRIELVIRVGRRGKRRRPSRPSAASADARTNSTSTSAATSKRESRAAQTGTPKWPFARWPHPFRRPTAGGRQVMSPTTAGVKRANCRNGQGNTDEKAIHGI